MKTMNSFAICAFAALLFASCAHGKTSFGPYSAAEDFYRKGDYPKAIEKYREYLALNPQGNLAAIAEYYIAKSYLVSGDKAQALANFEKVTKQYPGTSWAAFSNEQLDALKTAGNT